MEWVETTGRTIEEAKEAALDELGVDESEAEFEILEQPRLGLFGRLRSEARVRARVQPTAPRPKEDRRDRRNRGRRGDGAGRGEGRPDERAGATTGDGGSAGPGAPEEPDGGTGERRRSRRRSGPRRTSPAGAADPSRADEREPEPATVGEGDAGQAAAAPGGGRRARAGAPGPDGPLRSDDEDDHRREGRDVEVSLEEQARVAEGFLTQLVAEFGVDAAVNVVRPDEETVDLQLTGADLGLLIGQRGATLLALQDLTRTVVQRRTGASNGRIHVDVSGYRQRRAEALARFAQQVAATVRETGTPTTLEPMSAADRKVVHDAINGMDGVRTISEGEEPRRHVVVVPVTS